MEDISDPNYNNDMAWMRFVLQKFSCWKLIFSFGYVKRWWNLYKVEQVEGGYIPGDTALERD
jgi:hypothetical protein